MSGGFAYAQARIQARFGGLTGESVWQHLHASRTLPGFLAEARLTSLEPWISGLSPHSDARHIEAELDRRLRDLIGDARQWVPSPWRNAVDWTQWLIDLPLLQRLTSDEPPPLGSRFNSLSQLPSDARALTDPADPGKSWLLRWRQSWPDPAKRERDELEGLIDLTLSHDAQSRSTTPTEYPAMQRRFDEQLRYRFRRTTLQPTAVFSWLLLQALELQRLRGALVSRTLFTSAGQSS